MGVSITLQKLNSFVDPRIDFTSARRIPHRLSLYKTGLAILLPDRTSDLVTLPVFSFLRVATPLLPDFLHQNGPTQESTARRCAPVYPP